MRSDTNFDNEHISTLQNLVSNLKTVYADLNRDSVEDLAQYYHRDIEFIDPLNRIVGREKLLTHFYDVYENVSHCRFVFDDEKECVSDGLNDGQAFLQWEMEFVHKRLNGGKMIRVDGISHLRFDQEIAFHRDWYDVGQMVYEHLPIFGKLVRAIKQHQQV